MVERRIPARYDARRDLEAAGVTEENKIPWKTVKVTYEGHPLMLRCPQDLPFDRQAEFPVLLVIEHHLDQVTESGLPVTGYNEGLIDFDEAAVQLLQPSGEGVTVLVETFGGKRTYYSYVSRAADVDAAVARLLERFPGVRLEHTVQENADWRFLRRYAAEFGM